MKIKFVTTIVLLSITGLFSGCKILKKLTGNSSTSTGDYSALLSKKEELANFQTTGTLSGKETPIIKGKVVIVKKEPSGQAQLDRFDWEGKFSDAPVDKSSRFYPSEVYAKKPEEIETLIKVECREHKGSAYYKTDQNSDTTLQNYSKTICDVSIIDYKAKTLLAKVKKGDESAPAVISIGKGGDDYYRVYEEIANYLKSIPLELIPRIKPTPSGEVLAVEDIVKIYKKSKESLSQYQDKEITLTGRGSFSKTSNRILLNGNEKRSGVDYITCKINPNDMADFAEIKEYENYKFTVIGKFNFNYTMDLENCKLINSEKVTSK